MGCAVALSIAVSLALQATADVDVGLRTEGRTSTLSTPRAPPVSRASFATIPSAALAVDAQPLRLEIAYAPRIWSDDVGLRPSPIVNHVLDARLETLHDRPWLLEATVRGERGETDPLADPVQAIGPGGAPSQLATAGPLPYEALRAAARGELRLNLRTTLGARGQWDVSRARNGEDVALLPEQQTAGFEAFLSRQLDERNTLRVAAASSASSTSSPLGPTTGLTATASATWRRRITPRLDGWFGGGGGLAYTDDAAGPATRDFLPVGETGLALDAAGGRLGGEAVARLTSFVDRYQGGVSRMADARFTLLAKLGEQVGLAASASAGSRLDGETSLAALDVRVTWAVRRMLALEAGVVGRWQEERRPALPSFREVGFLLGMRFSTNIPTERRAGELGPGELGPGTGPL